MDGVVKNALLLIAISARPYAAAAKRAGFRVFVIDAFSDMETIDVAEQCHVCPFDKRGFIAVKLRSILKKIDLTSFVGCIFGSGFEARPQLLEEINRLLPIIGNSSGIVAQVRNPEYFFSALIGLSIPYPSIFNAPPKGFSAKEYLLKSSGGSGGQHIQYPAAHAVLKKGDYYQTLMQGQSVSVLFLATKANNINVNQASIIGFNAQWVDPTPSHPFRFGGAASGVELTQNLKNTMFEIVKKITKALGLLGLNSLDVMIQGEKVYVLEVNPRLSATVDLYAKDWLDCFHVDLMALHIQAGLGEKLSLDQQKKLFHAHEQTLQKPPRYSNAMAIVYAKEDVLLDESFKWPDWTQDRPLINQLNANFLLENRHVRNAQNKFVVKVLKGCPICSVFTKKSSEKNSVSLAQKELNNKIKRLTQRFNKALV